MERNSRNGIHPTFLYSSFSKVIRKENVKAHGTIFEIRERKEIGWDRTQKIIANSTWCSQAVTHPSTDHAQRCLTAVIRREPV